MTNNKLLVVIPARGGSKGIPRKNIKPFMGKPLVAWSIQTALAITDPQRVYLSTDDEEIAAVGESMGLPPRGLRPAHLATDTASSRQVILHAMEQADAQGLDYDRVVLLQPTSPLRSVEDVEKCIERYSPQLDMVVTVVNASANPYYNCYLTDPETGCLRIALGDGSYTRRQDCPKAWEMNGAVYVINPKSIREMQLGEMPRRLPVEMPPERSVDLDTPLDWTIAETVAKNLNS